MNLYQLLLDACSDLMAERPIEKISVAEILSRAGCSRATFYRYFRDKYELAGTSIVLACNRELYPYAPYCPLPLSQYQKVCRDMYENAALTRRLFTGTNRLSIETMSRGMQDIFEQRYCCVHGTQALTEQVRWGIYFSVHGYLATVEKWVLDGMKIPPDTLAEWLYRFRDAEYCI